MISTHAMFSTSLWSGLPSVTLERSHSLDVKGVVVDSIGSEEQSSATFDAQPAHLNPTHRLADISWILTAV